MDGEARQANTGTPQRLDFIDALRGLAIVGVLAVHSSQWVAPGSGWLRQVADNGIRGVQLFYVASALTLFLSLDSRRRVEGHPTRNYFIRRFFRIAPLFYLAIGGYLLLLGWGPRYWAPSGIEGWHVPLTALFLHGWHPETITSVVPGGWSIAVEMIFYLLVPGLYRRVTGLASAIVLVLGSLVVAKGLSSLALWFWLPRYPEEWHYLVHSFAYTWLPAQLPVFTVGIVVHHLMREFGDARRRRWGLLLLGASGLLAVAFLDVRTYKNLLPPQFCYAVAFGCLALGLHFHPTFLLVNPVTRWLGKVSYSLYLTHFAVIEGLRQAAAAAGIQLPAGNAGFLAAFGLTLLVSSAVSAATHRWVEAPGIRAGGRLIRYLERAPAGANRGSSGS